MGNIKADISDDFIGVIDGAFGKLCDKHIDYYNELDSNNLIEQRGRPKHVIDDSSNSLIAGPWYDSSFNMPYICGEFTSVFWNLCYPKYANKFSILKEVGTHSIYDIRIQKTSPGQGYHVWHCENGDSSRRDRLLVFSLFLNDVEEGGETEFLYQKRRVKPKKDRLLIFPSGFSHTHRGNQPISGDKYIITGWLEYTS
tara:strand:+ start:343 stop:936 length:594 start_codon:yes stop_codon:yes gene_type:complete